MPPTRPTLTRAQYLKAHLVAVAVPSAASPCPICQDPYTPSSPPALLRECGHIFCRPCITAWFNSGLENANKCPMDRKALFLSPSESETDMTGTYVAHTLTPHRRPGDVARIDGDRTRPVVELFMGRDVIAIDGVLTRCGCRLVVSSLWHRTARLLRSMEEFCGDEVDALSLDVETLGNCTQDAIPRGVRLGEDAWTVLFGVSRQMLVWHSDDRLSSGGWEGRGWVPTEELRGFVESLYETCSGTAE